jgi:hypothetical protein
MGDRRRHPRVSVLNLPDGQALSVQGPFVLRDLSDGGLAIESKVAFANGSRHRFRISGARGLSVAVDAIAMHSMRMMAPGGVMRYMTGFAFSDQTPDQRERITVLLEELSASA